MLTWKSSTQETEAGGVSMSLRLAWSIHQRCRQKQLAYPEESEYVLCIKMIKNSLDIFKSFKTEKKKCFFLKTLKLPEGLSTTKNHSSLMHCLSKLRDTIGVWYCLLV